MPMLSGFQQRKDPYNSVSGNAPNKGMFRLEFEDDLTENPDPYPEQLNTLNFIFDNQDKIAKSIIDRTLAELNQIKISYGLEREEHYQNLNEQKIQSLIGFSSLYIYVISKDGFSYFDFLGGCSWDEEHGLSILFHKDRVISFSGIDGNSIFEAKRDGGSFGNNRDNIVPEKEKPIKFFPHPKHNKLKPSHKTANEAYELTLISQGHNEDFIKGVENGEIEINGKCKGDGKTYLEAACWHNNNFLVGYLLSKKANLRYALHQCIGHSNNPEALKLLLGNGADINAQYENGNTVLFEVVTNLESFYRSTNYYKRIKRPDLITRDILERFEADRVKVKELIKLGADPFIKNTYGHSCFDIMRNEDEGSKNELNRFLEQCLNER